MILLGMKPIYNRFTISFFLLKDQFCLIKLGRLLTISSVLHQEHYKTGPLTGSSDFLFLHCIIIFNTFTETVCT
ncbi:hypothetical protein JD844_032140 [Phrynosoma platyrhinos]|uniref:Uncharacterized protein n=1 Tax=Phrynosoma platyrhinos TaxID=52577 RepID=A0ABQ7T4S9_PHRPL|nr:hypothetical protein JD844_032140 [Phrynosoma platyrhinos]